MTGRQLTNAEIADRLASFGALLDLAERSPFAVRAYRRAADVVRAAPVPIAELVRSGRVRELRGVGPGIESKLRELVETGDIAELRALEDELSPALVAYGRSLGLGATKTLAIARHLELGSVDEFRDAVVSGRIRDVPGVGAVTEARLRAGLERDPVALRGLTVRRSRELTRDIAAALGGQPAGPACSPSSGSTPALPSCARRRARSPPAGWSSSGPSGESCTAIRRGRTAATSGP